MDARIDERTRTPLHGVVNVARPGFVLLVGTCAAAAVAGGLWRAGLVAWVPAPAAVMHGPLMLSAFLGSVIALERAVALKQAWAFGVPLLAGASGLALLAGATAAGAALGIGAALLFVVVGAALLQRQRAPHTWLLWVASLAWLVGQVRYAQGASDAVRWWFLFPVLTIAAERLEMTRLARRRPAATPLLAACVALLAAGAGTSVALYGIGLMALAAWLFTFDIARHTVRAAGLPRFMAVCLLAGYAWLAVGGLAWLGMAFGCPGRDLALHALGLGFVTSMVMGHAPVILPALTGLKVGFGPAFYAPLVLLHGSLLWRFSGGLAAGAAFSALALVGYGVVITTHRKR